MTLDGLMLNNVRYFPLVVMVRCVRDKTSVCPHISDDVVLHVVVKVDVFEFIGLEQTNTGIMLCESIHQWFEFVAMYKTQIPHANVMKKD